MIITFGLALSSLCPEVNWSFIDDDYENCLWDRGDIPKPTREKIEAERIRMQAIEDARIKVEEELAVAAKQASLDKLAKLGLTPEDLKALLG